MRGFGIRYAAEKFQAEFHGFDVQQMTERTIRILLSTPDTYFQKNSWRALSYMNYAINGHEDTDILTIRRELGNPLTEINSLAVTPHLSSLLGRAIFLSVREPQLGKLLVDEQTKASNPERAKQIRMGAGYVDGAFMNSQFERIIEDAGVDWKEA